METESHECAILIEWEPLPGQTFNSEFSGYTAAHYATGNPELGWCLYSRGAGGCWNQRTKPIKAPTLGLQPERIDGQWYWVEPGKYSKEASPDTPAESSSISPELPVDDRGWPIMTVVDYLPAADPAQSTDSELSNALVDEVQRRMDSVVDAAVAWHQSDGEWSQTAEMLGDAIDALLELRSPTAAPTQSTPTPKTITVDYETWLVSLGLSQHNVDLNAALTRIIRDLPTNRDWLDPEIERWARRLTNEPRIQSPEVVPSRIRVSPPTQTMIEDAGPPSTFVQDKLAEALEPESQKWTLNYRWPTLEAVDFKTPRPGDGSIPVTVTVTAPDGQYASWELQGEVKDGALLSPEITPEVWAEISAWQEAWRPNLIDQSAKAVHVLAQLGTTSRIEPTSPELKAVRIDCAGCGYHLWCQIVNRDNTPVRCFRCEAITYVMRNNSEMDLSPRIKSDPAPPSLGEIFEFGDESK